MDRQEREQLGGITKELRRLRRELDTLARASQARYRSLEGGAMPVYDDDGVLQVLIGEQPDGSVTVVEYNGAPPPVPSAPIISEQPGSVTITWDGMSADGTPWPADFSHIEVHVQDVAGEPLTDADQVASFHSDRGGVLALPLLHRDDGTFYWVTLQAVTRSRMESDPSVQVPANPLPLAQTTGSGNRIFRQTATPVATAANDVWYGAGNLVYIATGAGTGIVGTDEGGVWEPAPVSANAVDGTVLIANDIYGRDGYFGKVKAEQLETGSLSAVLALLGGLTVTRPGGRTIRLDPDVGFQMLEPNGDAGTWLTVDPAGINSFVGDIVAQGLTIQGRAQLMGVLNELSASSTMTLQSGVTPPANYPTINTKVTTPAKASGYSYVAASGETLRTAFAVYGGETFTIPRLEYGKLADGALRTVPLTFTAGSGRATAANIRAGNSSAAYAFNMLEPVQIGSTVYALFWKYDSYNWLDYLRGDAGALPLPTGVKPQLWLGAFDAATGAMTAQTRWDSTYNLATWQGFQFYPQETNGAPPVNTPALATDGTYLYIGQVRPSDRKLIIQRFSPALALQATITTDLLAPTTTSAVRSLSVGAFDYGSNRYAVTFPGSSTVHSVTPAGATQAAEQWSAPTEGALVSWDGTRFMADGRYMSADKSSDTVWAAFTWRDDRAGGTGYHETTPGPVASAARSPRYGVTISVAAKPNDGGGADDPNAVGIYAVQGASSANMRLQGGYLAPPAALSVTRLDALDAGALAPASNTFPAGSASQLKSALGGFIVKGDGSGAWPILENALKSYADTAAAGVIEVGDIVPSGRTSKAGYLPCNGNLVSRTTYANLFSVIGHKFNNNVDPGGNNFKLPDIQDRAPMGASSAKPLGSAGGSDTHTLTAANMPEHSHQLNVNSISNTTSGGTQIRVNGVGGAGGGGGSTVTEKGVTDLAWAGAPAAVNHLGKYQAVNYFIKY